MKTIRFLLCAWLLCVCGAAAVAAPPTKAGREIEALIEGLGTSGCEFERNGSWYGAAEAQAHLRQKYAWLQKRGLVDSAEQFIERAASKSSVSGESYRVRCAGKPVTESGIWFRALLSRQRKQPDAT